MFKKGYQMKKILIIITVVTLGFMFGCTKKDDNDDSSSYKITLKGANS